MRWSAVIAAARRSSCETAYGSSDVADAGEIWPVDACRPPAVLGVIGLAAGRVGGPTGCVDAIVKLGVG